MDNNVNDQDLACLCSQLDSEGLAALLEIGEGIIALRDIPGDPDTLLLEYLRNKPASEITNIAIETVLAKIAITKEKERTSE